jgi:hypothetical protein
MTERRIVPSEKLLNKNHSTLAAFVEWMKVIDEDVEVFLSEYLIHSKGETSLGWECTIITQKTSGSGLFGAKSKESAQDAIDLARTDFISKLCAM